MNEVRNVGSLSVRNGVHIVFQFDPFGVMPDVVGVVAVREKLAVEAVELVDPLLVRVAACADESQSPFAESSCPVARRLQVVEDRRCP